MLSNNYAFEGSNPSFQLRLSDWAHGADGHFYWRHLLAFAGFSLFSALIFSLSVGVSIEELLLVASDTFGLTFLLTVFLGFGGFLLLAAKSIILNYLAGYSNTKGRNDNGKSIKYTLEVIKHARRWLVLYDYGEAQAGNIYSSAAVQDALLAKLAESTGDFKISMVFKKNRQEVNKLPLIQALKQWQKDNNASAKQVEIVCGQDRAAKKYRPFNQECNGFPDHYKINDVGYAYLTTHAETVARRKFIYYRPAYGWYSERVSDCLGFHNSVLANS